MTAGERRLRCPVWENDIPVPDGTAAGDMFDCPNCAGMKLRLAGEGGEETLGIVQMISCPGCGELLPIDDDTPAGITIRHDGTEYVLTKEFGAFALEAVWVWRSAHDRLVDEMIGNNHWWGYRHSQPEKLLVDLKNKS